MKTTGSSHLRCAPKAHNDSPSREHPGWSSCCPPEQRGVSVRCTEPTQRPTLLVAVQWGAHCVDVVSTAKRYSLDIRKVDTNTRNAALQVLGKMNFDQRFQLAGL